jgi:hypothetical protein
VHEEQSLIELIGCGSLHQWCIDGQHSVVSGGFVAGVERVVVGGGLFLGGGGPVEFGAGSFVGGRGFWIRNPSSQVSSFRNRS